MFGMGGCHSQFYDMTVLCASLGSSVVGRVDYNLDGLNGEMYCGCWGYFVNIL